MGSADIPFEYGLESPLQEIYAKDNDKSHQSEESERDDECSPSLPEPTQRIHAGLGRAVSLKLNDLFFGQENLSTTPMSFISVTNCSMFFERFGCIRLCTFYGHVS